MFTPPISMSIDIGTIVYDSIKNKFLNRKNIHYGYKKENNLEVSVLVPAFNECGNLHLTIDSIMQQTYPVKSIYILDDISTDNTKNVCRELSKNYEKVRHIRRDKKLGKAGNINLLIKEKGEELGDYVLVADGDVQLKRDCLENLMNSTDNAAIVTGFGYTSEPKSLIPRMLYEGESWINSVFSFRKKAQSIRNAVFVVCGALSLYKKDILQKVPIPERTVTEDTDHTWLVLENNRRVFYNDKGKAEGSSPNSLKGYWERYTRWFSGTFQSLYLHGFKELKKSKSLLYTTIAPGMLETVPYSIAIASLPVTAVFAPNLAKGVLTADFVLSFPFLFMHPKGFLHAVNHLPDIYAYKYFGSISCLYAGIKTSIEKILGKEESWKNTWDKSGRADVKTKTLSKRFLKKNFQQFLELEKEWTGISEEAWSEENFMLKMPDKWKFSSYAYINEKLAGYTIVSKVEEGKAFLHKIVIDNDYRRLGIGSLLLESTKEKCRRRDIEKLVFKANVNNYNANKFYNKHGCILVGKEKSRDGYERYLYELNLNKGKNEK